MSTLDGSCYFLGSPSVFANVLDAGGATAGVESIVLCKSPGPTEDEKGPRAALGLDLLT